MFRLLVNPFLWYGLHFVFHMFPPVNISPCFLLIQAAISRCILYMPRRAQTLAAIYSLTRVRIIGT